jgi:hypothetical protein
MGAGRGSAAEGGSFVIADRLGVVVGRASVTADRALVTEARSSVVTDRVLVTEARSSVAFDRASAAVGGSDSIRYERDSSSAAFEAAKASIFSDVAPLPGYRSRQLRLRSMLGLAFDVNFAQGAST